MALLTGSRLGAYEIISLIGSGGMGEVYRARDTRLKREVAIKVLPDEFSQDAERIARFKREAEVLASLNHSNIAAVYGLEKEGGTTAIVLELVDGETLAEIIARGPLAVGDALPIARQIADALETAHDRGVVHRDLKPANIKVTPEGKVKVLDFGLAKMLEPERAASSISVSPTLMSAYPTYAGVILGTAAYMSPEQARGKQVDRRTDIWAFGCVLFEMLTGKQAVEGGETISDAIASILKNEPDWNALPADTPVHIRALLRRCLQKDAQKRLPHIGIARLEIDEGPADVAIDTAGPSAQPVVARWRRLAWILTAVSGFAVGVSVVLFLWRPWRTPPPAPLLRLSTEPGAEVSLAVGASTTLILSPDGNTLAFVGDKAGKRQLYVRRLGQLQATPLAGTEDATDPFFSPDGQWIAFFATSKLKKISVAGGAAVTLCDAPNDRGGSWGDDDNIVFSLNTPGVGLQRVFSGGGKVEPISKTAEGEGIHGWLQVLPGARAIIYTASLPSGRRNDANTVVQPLPAGVPKVVQSDGYDARYLPSGHLVYIHDGTLFAVSFDLDRLEIIS